MTPSARGARPAASSGGPRGPGRGGRARPRRPLSIRRAAALAAQCLALAAAASAGGPARAQVAASLGLASESRYRGVGTADVGPVLRASAMGDAPGPALAGAYAGVSGLWRVRDGGLVDIDALAGWSGRWAALPAFADVDARWGWDVGVHRLHWGEGARYDFTEAMAGLLAPGAAARVWWAPHYFGGPGASVYATLDADHELDDRWRLFAHLGWLRNTSGRGAQRTDGTAGVGYTRDDWDLRLAREGLVGGRLAEDIDDRRRRPAWLLSATVAF